MLKLKRTEIYDEWSLVFEAGTDPNLGDKFLDSIIRRLGDQRFPLATVSRDEIQVGGNWMVGKRRAPAVVAQSRQHASQRAVFVCSHFGAYATFGVYHATDVGWFEPSAEDKMAMIKKAIGDFDGVVMFEAFHSVARLALDQVVYLDLNFRPLRPLALIDVKV